MKKLLYLFLFVSAFGFGQAPDIKGQFTFSPTQWETYAERILDDFSISGRHAEVDEVYQSAEAFYDDVYVNSIQDRGRWDNWHNITELIPTQQSDGYGRSFEPHSGRNNLNGDTDYPTSITNSSEMISKAALMAAAAYKGEELYQAGNLSASLVNGAGEINFNGSNIRLNVLAERLALSVMEELVWYANSDSHDASNGGVLDGTSTYYDGTTRPTRTNGTHGTFERYLHDPTSRFGGGTIGVREASPWWITAAKISKLLHCMGWVKEIIPNDAYVLANEDLVMYWFKDWVNFYYGNISFVMDHSMGSNWQNFAQDYSNGNSGVGTAGNRQDAAWYDGSGNPQFPTYGALWDCFNNRESDYSELMHTWGTCTGDATIQSWSFDWWKAFMAVYVDTDGTMMEQYRGGDGVPTLQYPNIILMQLTAMATTHANAVMNDFPNIGTDPRKYYDYESVLGSGDLYTSVRHDTSGTLKGLGLVAERLHKYWQDTANGGTRGERFDVVDNEIPEATNQVLTLTAGLLNAYYDTPQLQAADTDRSLGFLPFVAHGSNAFTGQGGIAWWLGGALGGETAAYNTGGVIATDIASFEAGGGGNPPSVSTGKKREENVIIN